MDTKIREYGDFQTPDDFVKRVNSYLKLELNIQPTVMIEPTFGTGNFIIESVRTFNSINKVFGIEQNTHYFNATTNRIHQLDTSNVKFNLFQENIFTFDFDEIKNAINKDDNILILGNPPWVTNSELSSLKSYNLPLKDNFKGLSGLDAITGKGNFDIAEYIILQLLSEFRLYPNCYIAMLCKNIVAKNIVRDLNKYNFTLSEIKFVTFDAKEIFDVSCQAGLLIMKLGKSSNLICDVYDIDHPKEKLRMFGYANGNFISNIGNYNTTSDIDGNCVFEWRQGIKHDCSKIMELSVSNGEYYNGLKEHVNIENNYVYPLLKSSDLKKPVTNSSRKFVIVTQTKVKEETDSIRIKANNLWKYLTNHLDYFNNRKSSIYKNSPKFSIFGIGEYSFMPYKVAISGFYKEPIFSLVYGSKPFMLDDTCYFIGFDNLNHALITMLLLNSPIVQDFVKSIAFLDSKRPYTKEILMRIDLKKAIKKISFAQLNKIMKCYNLDYKIQNKDYQEFCNHLSDFTLISKPL